MNSYDNSYSRVEDIEILQINGETSYFPIVVNDGEADAFCILCEPDELDAHTEHMRDYYSIPIDFEYHTVGDVTYETMIWKSSYAGWAYNMSPGTTDDLISDILDRQNIGYYPIDLEIKSDRYSALFTSEYFPHSVSEKNQYSDYETNIEVAKANNIMPIDFDIFVLDGVRYYSTISTTMTDDYEYIEVTADDLISTTATYRENGHWLADIEIFETTVSASETHVSASETPESYTPASSVKSMIKLPPKYLLR